MNILFVCLGNICRSPMAEFIAKNIIKKFNLNNISIQSCGTSGEHDGQDMHYGTKNILEKNNINSNNFKSKKINKALYDWADVIFVMDQSNYNDVINLDYVNNKDKIIKITKYNNFNDYKDVPDPWYTQNFQIVYDLINNCFINFLKNKSII